MAVLVDDKPPWPALAVGRDRLLSRDSSGSRNMAVGVDGVCRRWSMTRITLDLCEAK